MRDTITIPLHRFIEQHGLTSQSRPAKANPHMEPFTHKGKPVVMDHWEVTITRGRHPKPPITFTVWFSQGIGHRDANGWAKRPTLEDVLDSLASDAVSVANARDLDDWMADLGYGIHDLSRARRTYDTIQSQSELLKEFLGEEVYEQLLYHTDRL